MSTIKSLYLALPLVFAQGAEGQIYSQQSVSPPWAGPLLQLLGWVRWTAVVVVFLSLIAVAVMVAVGAHRGEGSRYMTGLGWVIGSAIIIGVGGEIIRMVLAG